MGNNGHPSRAAPGRPPARLERVGVPPVVIDAGAVQRRYAARAGWVERRIGTVLRLAARWLPAAAGGVAGALPLARLPVAGLQGLDTDVADPSPLVAVGRRLALPVVSGDAASATRLRPPQLLSPEASRLHRRAVQPGLIPVRSVHGKIAAMTAVSVQMPLLRRIASRAEMPWGSLAPPARPMRVTQGAPAEAREQARQTTTLARRAADPGMGPTIRAGAGADMMGLSRAVASRHRDDPASAPGGSGPAVALCSTGRPAEPMARAERLAVRRSALPGADVDDSAVASGEPTGPAPAMPSRAEPAVDGRSAGGQAVSKYGRSDRPALDTPAAEVASEAIFTGAGAGDNDRRAIPRAPGSPSAMAPHEAASGMTLVRSTVAGSEQSLRRSAFPGVAAIAATSLVTSESAPPGPVMPGGAEPASDGIPAGGEVASTGGRADDAAPGARASEVASGAMAAHAGDGAVSTDALSIPHAAGSSLASPLPRDAAADLTLARAIVPGATQSLSEADAQDLISTSIEAQPRSGLEEERRPASAVAASLSADEVAVSRGAMFVDASGARAVGPAMATVAATQDLPVVQAQFLASGAVGRPPPDRVVQRAPLLFALPPGNSIGHRPDALAAAPSAVAITSPSPAPPTFVWRNQALPGRATVGRSEVATAAPMLSLSPAPQPPISAATPGAGAAEAVPAATTVSGRTAAAGSGEAAGVASPSVLAEQVLRIVERRLEVERERRGGGSPWS